MAEQPNEFFEFIGIDPADPAKAKEEFQKKYVPRQPQAIREDKELWGGLMKGVNEGQKNIMKRVLKENGMDISQYNVDDDTRASDLVSDVLPKILQEKNATIEKLTAEVGKGTDKKLEEEREQFNKYKAEIEPKLSRVDQIQKEFDEYKNSVIQEKKQGKVTEYKTGAWKDFKWSQGISEFAKKGFQADIDSKYKIVLDDQDTPWPANEKGERIPNPKQAGSFKTLADILAEEGAAANAKGEKIMAVTDSRQPAGVKQTLAVKDKVVDTPANGRLRVNPYGRN